MNQSRKNLSRACSVLVLGLVLAGSPAWATEEPDLFSMSVEELLAVEVTTVARLPQALHEAPGIVTVITVEQMRQLGLRTIEETLQLVPGYEVTFNPRRSTVYSTSRRGTRSSTAPARTTCRRYRSPTGASG